MSRTERLFDQNAMLRSFSARVVSCEQLSDGKYRVLLDRTAFFPEEGGQSSDGGVLGGAEVLHVEETDGLIWHTVSTRLMEGDAVDGEIAFDERFRKMQSHTGEHIVSGIIHRLYGYENVGFHLSENGMTADFDGELDGDAVKKIELLANKAVFECHTVRAYYPSRTELETLEYRSKSGLKADDIRIVEIDGVDTCACCAPHVENTGEIGLIKLLDVIRYKGGVRIHMRCGYDALDDYCYRYGQIKQISGNISAKQEQVSQGVCRLLEENGRLKGEISALKHELMLCKLEKIGHTGKPILIFEDTDDLIYARNFANEAVGRTDSFFAFFAGNDIRGYKYIISSEKISLGELSKGLRERFGCKGGGSDKMIQGSCSAKKCDIEEFLNS